jgi:hypothetical protein
MYNQKQSLVRDLKELTFEFYLWVGVVVVMLLLPFGYVCVLGLTRDGENTSDQWGIIGVSLLMVIVGIILLITMIHDYVDRRNELRNQINQL